METATKEVYEKRKALNRKHGIDSRALDIAKQIDDIFTQGWHGVAQRTSRVQVLLISEMELLAAEAEEKSAIDDEYKSIMHHSV